MGGALAFSAFAAGGMELLAACGGNQAPANTQNAVKGGHMVEGQISDIANINPIFINDTASSLVAYMVYSRLLTVDGAGNLLPDLATAVPKVDADQVTYKVTLRDAKWSDGQPITSDDVVFTYQLMFDPKYAAVTSRFRSQLTQYLKSVTAPDSKTVVFTTTKPYAPFVITFMNIGILPKHGWDSLQPAQVNSSPLNQVPQIGSGVFLPVKWDKGSQYELKRNPLFWRGQSHLDSYFVKVVASAVEIANQLKTGELDVGNPDLGQWDS